MSALSGFGAPVTAPRIGVTGVVRSWEGHERAGVNGAYLRAVRGAGGAPVILSQLAGLDNAEALLDGVDGLVLTGGEDVSPSVYGVAASAKLGPVDPERDRFEIALFRESQRRSLPVLAICRGVQLVNAALGGTLWQDLPSERPGPVRHAGGGARDLRTHTISVAPGSRLASALGRHAVHVNSFHHQAIRELATDLVATAWAQDDLVEGVESEAGNSWLLGVQWHPEEMHADDAAPERGLFSAFIRESVNASERDTARSLR